MLIFIVFLLLTKKIINFLILILILKDHICYFNPIDILTIEHPEGLIIKSISIKKMPKIYFLIFIVHSHFLQMQKI